MTLAIRAAITTGAHPGWTAVDAPVARLAVAVDEAFMIDGIAPALIELYRQGKTIFVSTIQLSAQGRFFEEVQMMLPWATRIDVCPAVCSLCEKDAYYTVAKVGGLKHIEVGGSETYEPRCHEHTPFLVGGV